MAREGGASLLFFLTGTIIGACAGVLLAPKSGRETREDLWDWLKERKREGDRFLDKVKETLPEKKEQITAAVKAGKQAFYEASRHEREKIHA